MAREIQSAIGTKHGHHCTCRPLDPISVSVTPVVINRDCPGQREIPRTDDVAGRIVVTWPAPTTMGLSGWGVGIADADSGEPLTDVLGVRIDIRAHDQLATAHLERLVDAEGAPIGRGRPVEDEDGKGPRSAVLRYLVTEMRIAEA